MPREPLTDDEPLKVDDADFDLSDADIFTEAREGDGSTTEFQLPEGFRDALVDEIPGDDDTMTERRPMRPPANVAVVGIVGGVASGKSTLAKWLERTQGWPRIDADLIGHTVLTRDNVKRALRERFGELIFRPDGTIERRALAHVVFGASDDKLKNRRELEAIVHPAINDVIIEEVHASAQFKPTPGGIIVDAPVLLEAGLGPLCDRIIFLDTKESVRMGRAVRGRGWTSEEWRAREQSQWTMEKKRDAADIVVEAGLSVDETGQRAVQALTAPKAAK